MDTADTRIDIDHKQNPSTQSDITLNWKDVSFTIVTDKKKKKTKTLLNNVYGSIEPGQVVAIMGASGAGKTTLLNVLAGRIGKGDLSGTITVNGHERSPALWRSTVAYVEQEDLMYENLTVRETLQYAATLRLPSSQYTDEAKKKRVDEVIHQLSLSKCENSFIGGSGRRGISGGERKRVGIGIELVTKPRLLFLDEPTSGLDAFTAMNIVECIREVAKNERCTVLMTIHQPRENILEMFDKIVLLSEGKMVFIGRVEEAIKHFSKCGFSCPQRTNPSDYFLDVMTVDLRSDELKEKSLLRCRTLQQAWETNASTNNANTAAAVASIIPSTSHSSHSSSHKNGFLLETRVLLGRNVWDVLRDPATIGATIGQAIVNVILIGAVFFGIDLSNPSGIQNRIGVFFFICVNFTFGYVMPTLSVFTMQREIIKRERAAGTYRALSAYIAKLIAQIPLVIVSTLIFSVPVYWMLGLQANAGRFFTYLAVCVVYSITTSIMGIMISSGVPNVRVGQIIAPIIIAVFFLFAGQLVNLNTIPVFLRWLKWVSVLHYSYAALCINEFTGLTFGQCPKCVSGEAVLEDYGLNTFGSVWINVIVIAAFGVLFTAIGYVLFLFKSRPLQRLK